jgi:psiF repeat-containing protein
MRKTAVIYVLSGLLLTGSAQAQTKAPERSAASMECSRQANEKGLHGKARKHFRSKCLKAARKHG